MKTLLLQLASWAGVLIALAGIAFYANLLWLGLSLSGFLLAFLGMFAAPHDKLARMPPVTVLLIVLGQQFYHTVAV